MIGRIVVHTVYVIIIIMCYFIVSCIPVLIILYLIIIIHENTSKHTLLLSLLKLSSIHEIRRLILRIYLLILHTILISPHPNAFTSLRPHTFLSRKPLSRILESGCRSIFNRLGVFFFLKDSRGLSKQPWSNLPLA